MKKKVTALCAVLAVIGGMIPSAFAADVPEKTEISFKVGDSTLTVNGQPMEVTAPYVVGEGTTLVPIRVITEAFGAEVNWNGEEQSVNLKYPDVDITIKIGSKSAQVNTHAEELFAAPELYNDTTMVPLRFISETFGAKVDYNDGLITVTKEAAKETASTVEGTTDKEFIGDSYYGWSMKNPKNYKLTKHSFEGDMLVFESESGNSRITVRVISDINGVDPEEEYNDAKSLFSQHTISVSEKNKDGNDQTIIHIKGKSKEKSVELFEYVSEKRAYRIIAGADIEENTEAELFDIVESFSTFAKRDIYDLSNVDNAKRVFTSDDYGFSVKVDPEWKMSESSGTNKFIFVNPYNSNNVLGIEVVSKSDTVTAESIAEYDCNLEKNTLNRNMSEVSEVQNGTVLGRNSYYYTVSYNGKGKNKYFCKDVFIEVGDYIYNVMLEAPTSKEAEVMLSTFKVSEPDSGKLGKILRDSDLGESIKLDIAGGKIAVSSKWNAISEKTIENASTGAYISASKISVKSDSGVKITIPKVVSQAASNAMDTFKYSELYESPKALNVDGTELHWQDIYVSGDYYDYYVTAYIIEKNDDMYMFYYVRDDIYYNGGLDDEVRKIIASFETK